MSTSKKYIFFPFFQSISYNNVVVTKQIYFSSIFLKLWVHISDNIAGVLGDRSTTRGGIGTGKKKGIFSPVQKLFRCFDIKRFAWFEKT